MLGAGREAEKQYFEEVQKEDYRAVDLFSKKGVKVHSMTDTEFKAWKEVGKNSSWKVFTETVKNCKKFIDSAMNVR